MSDDSRLPSSERTYRTVKGVVANLVDSLEDERDQLAREVERLTLRAAVAQNHIDAVTDRYNRLRAALLYWRNECSGREPSLSVFERMVDHALSGDSHG